MLQNKVRNNNKKRLVKMASMEEFEGEKQKDQND